METFTLTIDGMVVEATPGMTVLQAAKKAGIFIPSLCAHDELSPYGACRMCVVEIDKVRGTPTSCTTPVTPGMVVRTNTEQLQLQRKRTLELMMSGHPSPCFSCDSREDCETEKAQPTRSTSATRCGTCSNRPGCELRGVALGNFSRDIDLPLLYDPSKVEKNDPFIDKDHNLCILCGRCFRVCEKIHDKPAIAIANRGKFAKISSEFGKTWSSEECLFCGACVEECPTGSLTDRWGKWFGIEDETKESICVLCPKHCKLSVKIKGGKVIGTRSVTLSKEDSLCALGKFAYPQIINSRLRINRSLIRKDGEQIPATSEEISDRILEILNDTKGKSLIIISRDCYYETRKAMRALSDTFKAKLIELPINSGADAIPADVKQALENGDYKAVIALGNYIKKECAAKIEHFVVADFAKSAVQKYAELVLPISILAENAGTFADSKGNKLHCEALVQSKLAQRPLSGHMSDVCRKLDIDIKKYDFQLEALPQDFKSPTESKDNLPHMLMGHYLSDFAPDLLELGFEMSPEAVAAKASPKKDGFKILENKTLAPNFHELKIHAPEVAKFAKAGQFAILMANAQSERSPFTIIDWNAEEGWVKFIIEELGRSSAEIGALKKGDELQVVSGPLGTPINLDLFKSGTSALLLGGCYGIGAIYPLARALKEKGVKVTSAIEASSKYMLFYEKKLASVSEKVIVRTRDGTVGIKGGNIDTVRELAKDFDSLVAIGCVFMMKQVASVAPKDESKVQLCSLNPIMVDGTGMCGACRVSVGGNTKFACVDGPSFELLKVDFAELGKRRTAYKLLEIEAMPRHIGGKCHQ